MDSRCLGRTGLSLTEIGFGASGFWGDRLFPLKDARAVLEAAAESGVRLIDTGRNYSGYNAERRLGQLLPDLWRDLSRDQWILSSKGGTQTPAGSIANAWTRERKDFSIGAIESGIHTSIRTMNCGYLDLFFLHGFTQADATDELLVGLARLKSQGVIRAVGINTHTIADMEWMTAHADVFDAALIDYSLIARDREPVIERMHHAGLGVLAGTVLAQGHLLPTRSIRSLKDAWYAARTWLKPSGRALQRAGAEVRQVLQSQTDMTPAQAAVAFVLSNPRITSAVIGSTSPAHLHEAISGRVFADTQEMTRLLGKIG